MHQDHQDRALPGAERPVHRPLDAALQLVPTPVEVVQQQVAAHVVLLLAVEVVDAASARESLATRTQPEPGPDSSCLRAPHGR